MRSNEVRFDTPLTPIEDLAPSRGGPIRQVCSNSRLDQAPQYSRSAFAPHTPRAHMPSRSGTRKAVRSNFPFAVSGRLSNTTIALGTMYSDNTAPTCDRSSSTRTGGTVRYEMEPIGTRHKGALLNGGHFCASQREFLLAAAQSPYVAGDIARRAALASRSPLPFSACSGK